MLKGKEFTWGLQVIPKSRAQVCVCFDLCIEIRVTFDTGVCRCAAEMALSYSRIAQVKNQRIIQTQVKGNSNKGLYTLWQDQKI